MKQVQKNSTKVQDERCGWFSDTLIHPDYCRDAHENPRMGSKTAVGDRAPSEGSFRNLPCLGPDKLPGVPCIQYPEIQKYWPFNK